MNRLVIFLIVILILSGCAVVFSPGEQDVTVKTRVAPATNPDKTKIFIDDELIGKGNEATKTIKKDLKAKQVRIEADSCKTVYGTILQDRKSPWHILTWIPFGILLYPVWVDRGTNTWNYPDLFEYDPPKYYIYRNSEMKHVYIDDLTLNVSKGNFEINLYDYEDYLANKQPKVSFQNDSLILSNYYLNKNLREKLVQLNFTDTTNSVFMDNLNTMLLNCSVRRATYNGVSRIYEKVIPPGLGRMRDLASYFISFDVECFWSLTDLYGDTLITRTYKGKSGEFAIEIKDIETYRLADMNTDDGLNFMFSKVTTDLYKPAIYDAIENTFVEFTTTIQQLDYLKKENAAKLDFKELTVAKPLKTPTNIDEAMKASFTIKSNDGHGSGFLVSQDGYIITNYHVVNNEKNLKAIDGDGKEYPVKVIRFNKSVDLALLKIEGNFEFAFSIPIEKNFQTGQDVMAIGTPKSVELGQSVSKGIISGYRTDKTRNYIQTDISVNRGNSGGAIVNPEGELLGVLEYKLYGVGTEGISFSIPAFDIMKSLSLKYQ